MLRVIIELVPNGEETWKYPISIAEIANITGLSLISDYACRLVRDGEIVALSYVIKHNRRDGAEALVARALKELEAARAGGWVDIDPAKITNARKTTKGPRPDLE
ncbi:MAG: hypothetical protein WCA22_10780 [Candidatus Binatus sp.]